METPLIINQADVTHIVNLQDIICCIANKGYCKVFTKNGEQILISKSMSKFAEELNLSFLKVSQSAIINRLHIQKIFKKQKKILLSRDITVSYSLKTQDLFELLSN
jgi:DNA-binding LytR/AlgR family response regulator